MGGWHKIICALCWAVAVREGRHRALEVRRFGCDLGWVKGGRSVGRPWALEASNGEPGTHWADSVFVWGCLVFHQSCFNRLCSPSFESGLALPQDLKGHPYPFCSVQATCPNLSTHSSLPWFSPCCDDCRT